MIVSLFSNVPHLPYAQVTYQVTPVMIVLYLILQCRLRLFEFMAVP